MVNYQDLVSQAIKFSSDVGITLPHNINLDGTIHRFCSDPERRQQSKDEWYIGTILESGHIVINFGTWKLGGRSEKFTSWDQKKLTKKQIAQIQREQQEHFEVLKKYNEEERKKSKERAIQIWSESKPCESHPYLERKSVKSHGLKTWKDQLVIPIYDAETDELQSLEFISKDGDKKFLKGGRFKSGYFQIGEGVPEYLGEGYSTCATVYEITGKAVICAFCCSNCSRVALHLKKRKNLSTLNLLQDADPAGEKVSKEWKEFEIGDVYKPDFKDCEGTDWNDLSFLVSKDEMLEQFKSKRYPSYSMDEFLSKEVKPVEWVINKMFTKGSFNILYASGGQGKSMLAMNILLCAQTGINPIDGYECKKQKTLYIDAELTESELQSRLKECYTNLIKGNPETSSWEHSRIMPWLSLEEEFGEKLNLYNLKSQRFLDPLIEESDFILLDNFDKVTNRGTSEDFRGDEKNWQNMWDWLKRWKSKGKTFLVLAHSDKMGNLKGTSKLKDDADTVIKIKRVANHLLPHKFKDRLSMILFLEKGRNIDVTELRPKIISLRSSESIDQSINSFETCVSPWEVLSFQDMETVIVNRKTDLDNQLLKF